VDAQPIGGRIDGGTIPLREIVAGAIGGCVGQRGRDSIGAVRHLIDRASARGVTVANWMELLRGDLGAGAAEDVLLLALAGALRLSAVETLTLALLVAVQDDPGVARAVAAIQAPVEGAWPTVGLAAEAFGPAAADGEDVMDSLVGGAMRRSGCAILLDPEQPLVERRMTMATSLFLALRGRESDWPGASPTAADVWLPSSVRTEAARQARALAQQAAENPLSATLVLRSGSVAEARAMARAICEQLGRGPVFLEGEELEGLAPWLMLRNLVPVLCFDLGPGERRSVPSIPCWDGPVLIQTGLDGALERGGGRPPEWRSEVPPAAEREELWRAALGDDELARTLGRSHRHGAGRIAELARQVRRRVTLAGDDRPTMEHVRASIWEGEGSELTALAQPLLDRIPDDALVLGPAPAEELRTLLLRCRARDRLAEGLGPSVVCRHRPGVRALFVGQSGTGKTLAAGWLAARLRMPLYRVDLAAVTSKYVGETEKNLAHLLARAENAEVVLLFDEADSIFGRRTDVQSSNDRFANAQTNYLLQRIETFDGVAILTSNSRARLDAAFTRRFDAIIEFPAPGPDERRELWRAHLGDRHDVSAAAVGKLAALVEFTGGHIRNVVLHAAVLAQAESRRIRYADVVAGLAVEMRKLGQQVTPELKAEP
jgi:hypothetical protein